MDKEKNGGKEPSKKDSGRDDPKESKDKGRKPKASPPSSSKSNPAPVKNGHGDGLQDGAIDHGHGTGGRKEEGKIDQVLTTIKKMATSVEESQKQFSERLDEQAAQISFLTDEWNLKTAGGSKKNEQPKKKVSEVPRQDNARQNNARQDDSWLDEDDDDDALLEVFGDDTGEVDSEDEKDEDNVEEDYDSVLFGKEQKGVVPSDEEVKVFIKRTKLSTEYGDDEWRNIKAKPDVKYWVGRQEAKDFAGPLADVDVPDLRYKNRKQNEKDLAECQKFAGAINLAQIKIAQGMKDFSANASITMGEFANPDIVMTDPRQEAAVCMEGVKEAAEMMMKNVGSLGKMAGFVFSKLLAMRRSQYIEAVDSSRTAREMVKRLQPSTRYLFGDSIKTVCRTLKEGSQLSTQLQRARNGRGGGGVGWRGRGGPRGGRGGPRGGGYRGGFRGGYRGGFRNKGNGRGKNKDD